MALSFIDVNSITAEPVWPLPDCESVIHSLEGSCVFSQLDIKAGFHNLPMEEDSITWTGFITQDGIYECTRSAFGLKGAPAHFQKAIMVTLARL